MALFAIGDLHLSFSVNKPMDIFGNHWKNYEEKIKDNWKATITEDDMILIPGDISWAIKLEEAVVDLEWIHQLPGKKILLKGNHDYWWGSLAKMNTLFDTLDFLQNNYHGYEEFAICGSRGWICPNDSKFTEQDDKIYKRELLRLEMSLEAAKKAGYHKIIVMTHYPPTNDDMQPSGFTELYEKYGVEQVVYGHLHTKSSFHSSLRGEHRGVTYHLVSSDYLNFNPLKIID